MRNLSYKEMTYISIFRFLFLKQKKTLLDISHFVFLLKKIAQLKWVARFI